MNKKIISVADNYLMRLFLRLVARRQWILKHVLHLDRTEDYIKVTITLKYYTYLEGNVLTTTIGLGKSAAITSCPLYFMKTAEGEESTGSLFVFARD